MWQGAGLTSEVVFRSIEIRARRCLSNRSAHRSISGERVCHGRQTQACQQCRSNCVGKVSLQAYVDVFTAGPETSPERQGPCATYRTISDYSTIVACLGTLLDRRGMSWNVPYSTAVFMRADRDGSKRSLSGKMAAPMAGASDAIAARTTGAIAGTSPARFRSR